MSGKNYKYPKLVYPLKVPLEYRGILEVRQFSFVGQDQRASV